MKLPADRSALQQIQAGSPYLTLLMQNHSSFVEQLYANDLDTVLQDICSSLDNAENIFVHLRRKKAEVALLIALADISGMWTLLEVTTALTKFADACVNAAVNHVLRQAQQRNKLTLKSTSDPSLACGYVVLAMGKHGAGELNYSSDIDLIILYDPETASLADGIEPSMFFVRFTRDLVALLQDVDEHGYVFRVDLRLRPDPRATQVAISLEAAAIYYENQGQNWERAAMIKARPVAGDIALGQEFLKRLTPYIWRKYLDYAAIADVQSLKRQIHAVKGHGEIAVQGHNLKLGRGGIREIEFFVQTQQLIAGGRNAKLRGLRTLDMLDALAVANWINSKTAEDMKSAYCFLRMLEHRAQMVDDLQTHEVPAKPEAFARFAKFSGFENGQALAEKLTSTLQTVQNHYVALFEDASELAGDFGSMVFTGGEDDPATLETLYNLGFTQASEVSATIRGWHFGRYAATRTARARELLTELMPRLLKTLGETGEADAAFLAFDQFLKTLPAGIQLFSMIKAKPNLLDLIALCLSAAPRLAQQLSQQPRTLEAVVAPDFFTQRVNAEMLERELDDAIPDATPRDEAMDRARVVAREQLFKVGVRILSETLSAEEAGRSYTLIADAMLRKLLHIVEADMMLNHGTVEGGQCAVIALGKLGSCEMTAGSDLDLILVYDHAVGTEFSNGPKPISVNQYYARLTQRFVTALTAPTAEGALYDVDLRLRPSGSKGPVAVSLASFISYHHDQSWTWEKLALTRARVVAGKAALRAQLNAAIKTSLASPRDLAATRKDVSDMRALMLREHKQATLWDIKHVQGGLIDVEFIAQYLQLIHAAKHPEILRTNTHECLGQAAKLNMISPADAAILLDAIGLYQRLTQLLRLCVVTLFNPQTASKKMNEAVCRAANMPDMQATEALMSETQQAISKVFDELIGRNQK